MFLFIFERKRQDTSRGEAEREGDTESEAGSRLWAVITEPDTGLEPMNCEIMTWAKVRHVTDWATQAPLPRNVSNYCGPVGPRKCKPHCHQSHSVNGYLLSGRCKIQGPDSSLIVFIKCDGLERIKTYAFSCSFRNSQTSPQTWLGIKTFR